MLKGEVASEGIGIGRAKLIISESKIIHKQTIRNSGDEIQRFHEALSETIKDTERIISKAEETEKEIMTAYLMIMQDVNLANKIENLIKFSNYCAEYAVEKEFDSIFKDILNIDDEYMKARTEDIVDIKNNIITKLQKTNDNEIIEIKPNTIIVTNELTLSDIAKLNLNNISGIITEKGNTNSHSSIVARVHSIPVVIGVKNATKIIKEKDHIAIDGETGEVHININKNDEQKLLDKKNRKQQEQKELEKYKNTHTKTKDGYEIKITLNIGELSELRSLEKGISEGIGLFRSELLYLNKNEMPTEEEQFLIYKEIAENPDIKHVIIRTLDIGGDKQLKWLKLEKEENPFLGNRGIRLCLSNLILFKTQLKAILRASYYGQLLIMFPMISCIEELRKAKQVVEECKNELSLENIHYNKEIKIGVMIEVPSAVLISNGLAKECDFFSIGTNDLIQYTTATERGNGKVSELYNKYHPAVINLIKQTIEAAKCSKIPCSMCGEAASDELLLPILIGLGLDEISINPNNVLKVKKIISKLEKEKCTKLVEKILNLYSAREVERILKEFIEMI